MTPRVWINSESWRVAELEAAVVAGGGVVSPPADADAIVWAHDDPAKIQPHLSAGVRWVQLSWTGVEDLLAAGIIDRERVWTATKGVYAGPIAEYCLAMLLAGVRRFPAALRGSGWAPQAPGRLAGSTLAIVGAGGIGRALIRLLAPFDVQVIAVTRSGADVPGATRSVAVDALDEIVGISDAIVIAAPQTAETVGLISAERMRLMRPGAVLINVARGPLVDTDALVAALRDGPIGAAFLDVTDPEPLPDDHPLWSLTNAVVTSHTASTPVLGAAPLAQRVRENVARFARGDELLGIVDRDAGY